MSIVLNGIEIENFKSFTEKQYVKISDLSVLLGANSSGKSTALQALLVLKQTLECNSPDEELLLSGKYVTLGDFDDVISDKEKSFFSLAVVLGQTEKTENEDPNDDFRISWRFERAKDGISASLKQLDVIYGAMNLAFKRTNGDPYQMFVDGVRYPFSAIIKDLIISEYNIHYDKNLNLKLAEFLKQLSKILLSHKTMTIAADKLIDGIEVRDFYFRLLNKVTNVERDDFTNELKDKAQRICHLIRAYRDKLTSEYEENIDAIPNHLQEAIIQFALREINDLEELNKVISDHEQFISEYSKIKHEIDEFSGICNIGNNPFEQFERDNGKKGNLSQLKYSLDFYKSFLDDILSKLFFVGPIREMPKGLYNIGFETIPKYVGPTGAYFASVLLHESKKVQEYILPKGKEKCSLSDALAIWMTHLKVASSVDVDKKTSFGFSVSVENMEQVKSDIMNVGIGTSQILPVLITVLLSEPGEIIMFEQPELHLHPYSQSRLADMFVEFCKQGRKIILETHSEYFILRLRYHIVKEDYSNDSAAINFFQNSGGTKVTVANISGFGNIDYPEDFRDETQELLDKILDASLKRKGLS